MRKLTFLLLLLLSCFTTVFAQDASVQMDDALRSSMVKYTLL